MDKHEVHQVVGLQVLGRQISIGECFVFCYHRYTKFLDEDSCFIVHC